MADERKLLHFDKFRSRPRSQRLASRRAGNSAAPEDVSRRLSHLVQNAGRLVSKDELIEAVWRRAVVTDDSLAHCLSAIREALDDANHQIVRPCGAAGYLFAAAVFRGERDPGAVAKAEVEATDYVAKRSRGSARPDKPVGFRPPAGGDRESSEAFAVSNIPIRVPAHFMGRDDAIEELDRAIHS